MAYLSQASATVANSSKLTISAWVQFTSDDAYVPIFEFGDTSGSVDQYYNSGLAVPAGAFRSCRIFKHTSGGFPMLFVNLAGPYGSFSEGDILAGFSGDTANPFYSSLTAAIGAGSNWTPTVAFVAGDEAADITSTIAPGKWFHLFLSIDFSSKDGAIVHDFGLGAPGLFDDPDHAKRVWFLINGQSFGIGGSAEPDLYDGTVSGTDPNNGYCRTQLASAEGGSISIGFGDSSGSYGQALYELPPWTIALNGNEFAIPCVAENAAGGVNPANRFGDIQIWVDQYIDASNADNLAKFITAEGKAVNPTVAEAAFGAPTFRFRGPASGIATNTGTGGAFTKTGTVTDYAPGP
jgi:hypothetical protein